MGDKEGRSVEEHERERDEELNASAYKQSSTALKPLHDFLLPFRFKLGNIQKCVSIGMLHCSPYKRSVSVCLEAFVCV